MNSFKVEKEDTLLNFLFAQYPNKSKTTVKSYLSHRQVSLNGMVTTQFDAPLRRGNMVEVTFERMPEVLRNPLLKIVYEDDYLIVVNKKEGLLSIATDKITQKTAFNILSDYVKKKDPANKIFVLHRLDRETSGLMMFSKDQKIKFKMQTEWNDVVVERKYYAVVEGLVPKNEDVISTYLTESKALIVYATTKENGKIANTQYKVLKRSANHTLLELELETGRKNQIRCHLNYIGFPIIGDKKYGAKTNPLGRVALHAACLSFIHPTTGKRHDFRTAVPTAFDELFK